MLYYEILPKLNTITFLPKNFLHRYWSVRSIHLSRRRKPTDKQSFSCEACKFECFGRRIRKWKVPRTEQWFRGCCGERSFAGRRKGDYGYSKRTLLTCISIFICFCKQQLKWITRIILANHSCYWLKQNEYWTACWKDLYDICNLFNTIIFNILAN